MNYTPEILEQKFNELPDDVKNALTSDATAEALIDIGTKNGLLEDRVDVLINETGFVMLGLTHPSQFVGNLTTSMGISRENAQRIAGAINEAIFAPIRESLKKIHNIGSQAGTSAPDVSAKKLDIVPEPATAPHAEKLERVTARPPEEIRAVDEIPQQKQRPFSEDMGGAGDPYREPV